MSQKNSACGYERRLVEIIEKSETDGDLETLHREADRLMSDLVRRLGYKRVADLYDEACGGFYYV